MKKQFVRELGVHGIVGLVAFAWIFGHTPLAQSENHRVAKSDKVGSQSIVGYTGNTPIVDKASTDDISIVIEPTAAPAGLPELGALAKYVTVSATKLKLRLQPTSESKAMGIYPNGTSFEQIGQQGKWIQVRHVQDGTSGWMHGDYMKPAS